MHLVKYLLKRQHVNLYIIQIYKKRTHHYYYTYTDGPSASIFFTIIILAENCIVIKLL